MDDWLQLKGKRVLVTGLSNRRSVAAFIGQELRAVGALPIWMVRTEERREEVAKITGDDPVFSCDVREQSQIDALAEGLEPLGPLHGLVHSIAFARYEGGAQAFHKTPREHFLEAVDVSCFSLIALAGALEEQMAPGASVVTISISTTTMAAESYGYMAPAKAALDSAVAFLAKSLATKQVRVNAVRAGLLKTRSSAGIPGYADAWLFAEQATLRHEGLSTEEVAQAALFLLSPRSSGIAGQGLVVDAGMGLNYFDATILDRATRLEGL